MSCPCLFPPCSSSLLRDLWSSFCFGPGMIPGTCSSTGAPKRVWTSTPQSSDLEQQRTRIPMPKDSRLVAKRRVRAPMPTPSTTTRQRTAPLTSTHQVSQCHTIVASVPLDTATKMLNCKVKEEEIVEVAKCTSHQWGKLAVHLDAKLFSHAKRSVLEQEQRKLLDQALAMMEVWVNKLDYYATRGKLIKAMCDTGFRAQANSVFGSQLVELVVPSSET